MLEGTGASRPLSDVSFGATAHSPLMGRFEDLPFHAFDVELDGLELHAVVMGNSSQETLQTLTLDALGDDDWCAQDVLDFLWAADDSADMFQSQADGAGCNASATLSCTSSETHQICAQQQEPQPQLQQELQLQHEQQLLYDLLMAAQHLQQTSQQTQEQRQTCRNRKHARALLCDEDRRSWVKAMALDRLQAALQQVGAPWQPHTWEVVAGRRRTGGWRILYRWHGRKLFGSRADAVNALLTCMMRQLQRHLQPVPQLLQPCEARRRSCSGQSSCSTVSMGKHTQQQLLQWVQGPGVTQEPPEPGQQPVQEQARLQQLQPAREQELQLQQQQSCGGAAWLLEPDPAPPTMQQMGWQAAQAEAVRKLTDALHKAGATAGLAADIIVSGRKYGNGWRFQFTWQGVTYQSRAAIVAAVRQQQQQQQQRQEQQLPAPPMQQLHLQQQQQQSLLQLLQLPEALHQQPLLRQVSGSQGLCSSQEHSTGSTHTHTHSSASVTGEAPDPCHGGDGRLPQQLQQPQQQGVGSQCTVCQDGGGCPAAAAAAAAAAAVTRHGVLNKLDAETVKAQALQRLGEEVTAAGGLWHPMEWRVHAGWLKSSRAWRFLYFWTPGFGASAAGGRQPTIKFDTRKAAVKAVLQLQLRRPQQVPPQQVLLEHQASQQLQQALQGLGVVSDNLASASTATEAEADGSGVCTAQRKRAASGACPAAPTKRARAAGSCSAGAMGSCSAQWAAGP